VANTSETTDGNRIEISTDMEICKVLPLSLTSTPYTKKWTSLADFLVIFEVLKPESFHRLFKG